MASRESIRRQQLVRQAEGYLELGMPHQALAVLTRLETSCTLDGQAKFVRGEAMRSLEQWEEAIPWLRDAADSHPDNIHIWLALGWCYKRTGQIFRAIEALESALAVDSSEGILHYNLACYWSLARNRSRALDYLAQAIDIDTRYRDMVHEEPDFDPIRSDPDFQALTALIV